MKQLFKIFVLLFIGCGPNVETTVGEGEYCGVTEDNVEENYECSILCTPSGTRKINVCDDDLTCRDSTCVPDCEQPDYHFSARSNPTVCIPNAYLNLVDLGHECSSTAICNHGSDCKRQEFMPGVQPGGTFCRETEVRLKEIGEACFENAQCAVGICAGETGICSEA